ncbi:MAG: hypothetical protein ACPGSL_03070 [Vicingaceae bacterium]
MKKLTIILLLLLVGFNGFGQDFGDLYTKGNLTKNDVLERIGKDIEKGRFEKGIPPIFKEVGNMLVFEVESTYYKFTLKMTFNLTIDSVTYYCDFVQYIFHCEDWSIKNFKQLKSFFSFYDFRKINKNQYLSNSNFKTVLDIEYNPNDISCLTFTYSHFDTEMTKKEYKNYHKKFPKLVYDTLPYPFKEQIKIN